MAASTSSLRRGACLLLLLVAPTLSAQLKWPVGPAVMAETELRIRALLQGARVAGEHLAARREVNAFYRARAFSPAWFDRKGISTEAVPLLRALRQAGTHGLDRAKYHHAWLEEVLLRPVDSLAELTHLDVLLTDAFLAYANDIQNGRVDPTRVDHAWPVHTRPYDLPAILDGALARRTVEQVLRTMPPPQDGYRRLRRALADYRERAARGGWPPLPEGEVLRRGSVGERVVLLRNRLSLPDDERPLPFDVALETAVKDFQGRHGLRPDGQVGERTRAALNMPVEARIEQLALNLERWRWLPRTPPARHLVVNMASFRLDVVEQGRPLFDMRVIVGRDYRQTPTFMSDLHSIVFNPYWYIPQTVFVEDILPRLRRDPSYLTQGRLRVFSSLKGQGEEVDPASIDWNAIDPARFPYVLRQDAGANNSLGQVKFMLNNSFGIYLHDTSRRDLFDRPMRALSSGCIRLEEPLRLAEYVLREEPQWNRGAIDAVLQSGRPTPVRLSKPLPVYLVYFTAWVDGRGSVHFRDDVYGRDAALAQALGAQRAEALLSRHD